MNAQNYAEGAVQILLNNRDGTFRDATELILQPAWERHGSLYSDIPVYVDRVFPADFNGDGFIDLLVQGNGQPSRLFLNTGPAGGGRLVEVTELLPDSANHFAVDDFNGDGSPDIAAFTDECCNRDLTLESWLSTRQVRSHAGSDSCYTYRSVLPARQRAELCQFLRRCAGSWRTRDNFWGQSRPGHARSSFS